MMDSIFKKPQPEKKSQFGGNELVRKFIFFELDFNFFQIPESHVLAHDSINIQTNQEDTVFDTNASAMKTGGKKQLTPLPLM